MESNILLRLMLCFCILLANLPLMAETNISTFLNKQYSQTKTPTSGRRTLPQLSYCVIDKNNGVWIEHENVEDILSYEIRDLNNVTIDSFSTENDFTEMLFQISEDVQIIFHFAEYDLVGFVYLQN